MIRKLFFALLCCNSCLLAFAQEEEEQVPFETDRFRILRARLYGKVVDSKTNRGIEAASVQVFATRRDSMNNPVDTLIAGMLTKPNGDFTFFNVVLPDTFSVKFTAIGFKEREESVILGRANSNSADFQRDLGNIGLGVEADFLGAVTVVGIRPPLQLGIDRKVFNVDKSLTSSGGTAIDVMRNIPSLTVDVEGNVQLRNSNPQIFVDGRPTILTLEQIPADDIERVELITNPSSKFDAATTAGIINVVLKKNRRLGLNGIISTGIGTPNILTGNATLNLRQGKFNFFTSANYNRSGGVARSEAFRQNRSGGVPQDYFEQVSENERFRRFTSIRFGVDYFVDNRNTISISQNFVKGRFTNFEQQDQRYLNSEKVLFKTGDRFSDSWSEFDRSNTVLNYRHSFPKSGHELTADVTYNIGDGTSHSLITNYFNDFSGGVDDGDTNVVRNRGNNDNDQLTLQIDYANPISENSKIEMGLRSFFNQQTSLFGVFSVRGLQESKLPLSNNYAFDETIHAGYVTYSNRYKGIGYQVGLRAEYSKFVGKLIDSSRSFGYTLPLDIGELFDGLFPSLYLTKPIGDNQEVQLNFSRRIRRPNFWQLNPFIDINDPLNISQGNPEVRPEYVNSFEFNYSNRYEKGSFLAALYFRNNQGDITRYSDTITAAQYQQLNNAAIDPNAILNTFINAQFTNRMGLEFTLQQKFGENLEIIPNLNMQYRKVKAVVNDLNLSNSGFSWEAELTMNYKLSATRGLFKDLSFQLTGEYESPEVIPQGRNKEQYVLDFALRKEFLKSKAATFTFSINDVLNSRRFGSIYDTENFYQDSYRRWNVRSFRVTLSYRFGSKDIALFKDRGEERRDNDND